MCIVKPNEALKNAALPSIILAGMEIIWALLSIVSVCFFCDREGYLWRSLTCSKKEMSQVNNIVDHTMQQIPWVQPAVSVNGEPYLQLPA